GTGSVDFNPVVDRIRFVHSGGTNLRLNAFNGALAATDTPVTPGRAIALAYDRSTSPAPTATSLFAIDDLADTMNLIGGPNGAPSPNTGAVTAIGALGVDTAATVGFDIAPQGDAIATLSVGGSVGLYTVDLGTGAATLVGPVGAGSTAVVDIALPRPPVGPLWALSDSDQVVSFNAASPGTATSVAITGMQPGEHMVGFDVRPATGELIGIGMTGTDGRVYRIDPATGAATQIGTAPFTVTATAPTWSVDFNPTVDRIRLISSSGDNYRVNPLNGALAATDTDVAPAKPTAAAYDRSVATATATTLFAIDDVAESLNTIGGVDGTPSPNLGATVVRGPLGVTTDSPEIGFDISPIGEGLATLSVAASTGLYTIDLASGNAELVGAVGMGTTDLIDLAVPGTMAAGASQFTPVAPARLLDTRESGTKPAGGSTTQLQVTGVAGVPANATAVVLNTTGTEATADGFVTVYPAGEAQPTVSNHNLTTGQTRANLVTVKVGAGGKVSFFTQSGAHLIADVLGYYAPPTATSGRFTALSPTRLADTRTSGAKLGVGGTVTVPVLGQQGVPATGVSAVLVNVAGTEAAAPGFVTVYASGTARPATSNLNLEMTGSTASNLAIVPVGADGSVTVFSQSGTHIIVDVAGWFGDATSKGGYSGLFVPVSPSRVLDTRSGLGAPTGALPINGSLDLTLAGVAGIPAFGATAAVINLTAVEAVHDGFVTVYPSGTPLPVISSLNVDRAGQTTPNLVGATLGAGGKVTILHQAGGHLVADVAGWFTA
ncbi:MAG: DUF4394 domain-containing protein, partial [Actinobacteria bacterium]|nr:DUF4394 domain-containing protein [Actinomycetota bacterium]